MRATQIPGVVFAFSCGPCRAEQHMGGEEYQPGRFFLGAIHAGHVPELEAIGWETGDDGDIVCPHYAALCAENINSPTD